MTNPRAPLFIAVMAGFVCVGAHVNAQPWQLDDTVALVRFLSNKRLLTLAHDGTARIVETQSGRELLRFTTGAAPKILGPNLMATTPDGDRLAIVSQEGRIRLWDTTTGKELRSVEVKSLGAVSVVFAPDGKTLAIRSKDQVVHLVSLATGKRTQTVGESSRLRPFHGDFFAGGARCDNSLLFVPDNLSLFTLHVTQGEKQTGTVRLWGVDAAKGKELLQSTFRLNNPFFDVRTGFGVASLAYGGEDKVLLAWASSDGTARLLEVSGEKEIRRLPAVQQGVYIAFVFSPDAKTLATRTSNSTSVRLHDVATGRGLHVLGDASVIPNKKWAGDAQTLSFSPDGLILAEGEGRIVRLWNVTNGLEITARRVP